MSIFEDIKIASMNCRGLANKVKRRDVFDYMRKKQFSIICLQDVHFESKQENQIAAEWGLDAYFSSFKSNSRGVAILLNNNFEYKVKKCIKDPNGNFVLLDITTYDTNITLGCVYGPNKDNPQFYSNLLRTINEFSNSACILCGDWNMVIDPAKDTQNYVNVNNPNARKELQNLMNELNLTDIWRKEHKHAARYTWRQHNPRKQARLDYYLVSEDIEGICVKTDIAPGYRTDHSLITLTCRPITNERGRGYWKLNTSLLKDKEYIDQVKQIMRETTESYASPHYDGIDVHDIPKDELQFKIDDGLFLETLLMNIRGKTISYASWKKKNREMEERTIEEDVKLLETEVGRQFQTVPEARIDELRDKKKLLQEIRANKVEGIILRSKARWIDQGEKPTKYFLNLEKRNYVSKLIPKIITEDGIEIRDGKEILEEQKRFYQKLYTEKDNKSHQEVREFLHTVQGPKLSNTEADALEGKITYAELTTVLKKQKNNKTPGIDGYSAEF